MENPKRLRPRVPSGYHGVRMPEPRPVILMTEGSAPTPLAWLRERAEVREVRCDAPDFADHLAVADGMCVRTYTKVTLALLDAAPKLKVVGRGGIGLENIDVPACRSRGVEVVYTPGANTLAVGDFVFGLMIQLLRPFAPFGEAVYPPAEFKRLRDTLRGRQLNELTLGILGMGRVGRRVGRIGALGFGMNVVYHDLLDVSAEIEFPAAAVSADELYRSCDVLTIHVDARPGNANLVNADILASLKASTIVINTSRGEVLDVNALASALRQNHVGGAAVDVYQPEPPAENYPLLGLPNVILTPHMAARTSTAIENMSWVAKDVEAVLRGRPPEFPVPQ